ncbi:MAG: hypothetical protein H0U74_10250 [Bradymonadaceae bacterium]|nr:hypothetical protein [Lujinxingiaceae bacterium]
MQRLESVSVGNEQLYEITLQVRRDLTLSGETVSTTFLLQDAQPDLAG